MNSTVIGGAMLPHAPQFFTMPDTEDKATVERVRLPPPRPPRADPADLRQRLSTAAAHHGTLLRFRRSGCAHCDYHGIENRRAGERGHVAFPWNRALFQSGTRLGQAGPGTARA